MDVSDYTEENNINYDNICQFCGTPLYYLRGGNLIKETCVICPNKLCRKCSHGSLCNYHYKKLSLKSQKRVKLINGSFEIKSQKRVKLINGSFEIIKIPLFFIYLIIFCLICFIQDNPISRFIINFLNYLTGLLYFFIVYVYFGLILLMFLSDSLFTIIFLGFIKRRWIKKITLKDYNQNDKSQNF
ncbi:MAG: hypothetical protein ACTSPW_21745 [Promethearchaeota archaeon]